MSTQISTELVKELRDATGISIMQCKRALEEAGGDMTKALAILKKTSSDIALKKADRETKDGRVAIKSDAGKSVLMALHCETDFVAKNEDFVNLLKDLLDLAWEKMSAQGGSASGWKEEAKSMIAPVIQKTGENIELGVVYEVKGDVVGSYVHNDKIGIIVSLEGGNSELARDIAMHTAAMKPEYISEAEIDEEAKKTVMEIFQKEVDKIDKPEEIKKKMLDGKMGGYFKEKTLLSQPFIKDGDKTIEVLLKEAGAKIKEIKRYSI